MRGRWSPWIWLALAIAVACGGATHVILLSDPARAPPDVRQGCDLTALRCSSCHTLDRILSGPPRSEGEWTEQVERMRMMPASGITTTDAPVIVRCLAYRDSLSSQP